MRALRTNRTRSSRYRCRVLLVLGVALSAGNALAQDIVPAPERPADASTDEGSSFLFVPYPITEPTIGNGLVAGPVWMRKGPPDASGPAQPQAFGFGALWTTGGSRGLVAFDRRAWADGRWWTTVIAGSADVHLTYSGLLPDQDQDRGFMLKVRGVSAKGERRLGMGPNSLAVRLFASSVQTDFDVVLPVELSGSRRQQQLNGLALTWSQDTRDELYTPSSGHYALATWSNYGEWMGASFDANSLMLQWVGYRKGPGKSVLGARVRGEMAEGDMPFYLRPYVAFRGIPALRYAGQQTLSLEGEFRWPVSERWDALAFGGTGKAWASRGNLSVAKTVSAAGVGIRFKAKKYFGLTLGLDIAQGPDGLASYIQIGNAWSR